MKLIIAPHVIDESHLQEIEGKLKRPAVRYTQAKEADVQQADCLIIDCFGLLSSIYRYGEMAYITDFQRLMDRLLSDTAYLSTSGKAAGDYVKNNAGALDKIMETVKF